MPECTANFWKEAKSSELSTLFHYKSTEDEEGNKSSLVLSAWLVVESTYALKEYFFSHYGAAFSNWSEWERKMED